MAKSITPYYKKFNVAAESMAIVNHILHKQSNLPSRDQKKDTFFLGGG